MAGIFNFAALKRERPSEIAVLFRLARVAVVTIGVGMGLTLVFGLWLVHNAGYGWGQTWIVLALVLWVLSNALGGIGGGREKRTRELAERLAAEGDAPSQELTARLRDPVWLAAELGQRDRHRCDPRPHDLEAGRMMLALVRPDSWNFPLFLHVLGAIVLAGSTGAVTVLALAARKRRAQGALLSRLAFRTLIFVVVPVLDRDAVFHGVSP